MIISVNRERLLKALEATVKLAKANKFLLNNVVVLEIDSFEENIKWHANDGMIFAMVKTPAQFKEARVPALFGIQGSLIKDIIESCDKKVDIIFEISPDNGRLKIKQGAFETEISCLSIGSLFDPKMGEIEHEFTVHAPFLIDAYDKVAYAVGTKECADKRLCAIHAFSKEGNLIMEATNGKVMSRTTLEMVNEPEGDFVGAIPPAFLHFVTTTIAGGEIDFRTDGAFLLASAGMDLYQITTRLMPVNRIASEKVLLTTSEDAVVFDIASDILSIELTKITSLVQNNSYLIVNCTISKDSVLQLHCGTDLNSAHSVIAGGVKELSHDISFNISANIFCDSLASITGLLNFTVDIATNKCIVRQCGQVGNDRVVLDTDIRMMGLSY